MLSLDIRLLHSLPFSAELELCQGPSPLLGLESRNSSIFSCKMADEYKLILVCHDSNGQSIVYLQETLVVKQESKPQIHIILACNLIFCHLRHLISVAAMWTCQTVKHRSAQAAFTMEFSFMDISACLIRLHFSSLVHCATSLYLRERAQIYAPEGWHYIACWGPQNSESWSSKGSPGNENFLLGAEALQKLTKFCSLVSILRDLNISWDFEHSAYAKL